MRCQHCGGQRGALPGMVCPGCGSARSRMAAGESSWVAQETLTGRVSTLPRRRKALLAAGVVVAAGGLATVAALLLSGGGSVGGGTSRTDAAGRAGALPGPPDRIGGGAPTRIGPGEDAPAEPSPEEPSAEAPEAPEVPDAPGSTSTPEEGRRFTQWAGPGCTAGEYREYGRFERGEAGWYAVASGGFTGGGCDGRFSAVPMSGSPTEDRGSTATWSWHLGEGFRSCALTVFVPEGRARDVAGDPTVYRVLSDPADAHSAYTGFAVRQTQHRGSAVEVGTYPVKGDAFAVLLIDRGRDWGASERVGAHHAAAQMRVVCR
ncbi:adhesin [Streptomyces cyaneofuscatus]|uniref:Adhesin n=2 Tax=Streptomyces TaxID=1883 RepID=A0ABZ1EW54_9ACTN|nr:adhesin [Streptomyces cyaneofuscatus]WSB08332.1 adhesin [Streptomyces cyaneofuscatus]WSD48135.1 adhesin [Streptomyces cyaneofuscatus]